MVEFRRTGILAEQQSIVKVIYEGEIVGNYRADILVEKLIILDLKCVDKITNVHKAQSINYLKATKLKLSLILNFKNNSLESKRIVL